MAISSSIITRNIAQLGRKFLEALNYQDIDYRGFLGETADPTLTGGYVLVNDFKLWNQSGYGDYYRRPSTGGFLTNNIRSYSTTPTGAQALDRDYRAQIAENFPTIEIIELSIYFDSTTRRWNIRAVYRDTVTKLLAPFQDSIEVTN